MMHLFFLAVALVAKVSVSAMQKKPGGTVDVANLLSIPLRLVVS